MCRLMMDVWIHSDSETGEPAEMDFFEFTGSSIPASLIAYLLDGGRTIELEAFEELETETIYRVIVKADFEGGAPEFGYPGVWGLRCESSLRLPMLPAEEEQADVCIAASAKQSTRLEIAAAWVRDGLRRQLDGPLRSPFGAEMAARLDAALKAGEGKEEEGDEA